MFLCFIIGFFLGFLVVWLWNDASAVVNKCCNELRWPFRCFCISPKKKPMVCSNDCFYWYTNQFQCVILTENSCLIYKTLKRFIGSASICSLVPSHRTSGLLSPMPTSSSPSGSAMLPALSEVWSAELWSSAQQTCRGRGTQSTKPSTRRLRTPSTPNRSWRMNWTRWVVNKAGNTCRI